MKWIGLAALFIIGASGCGMSDQELKDKAGDAAVSGKKMAEQAADSMKGAYDSAAEKGRELAASASETFNDVTLKGKIIAGFKLVKDTNADNVTVDVKDGIVTLTGTVPTELDKMKVEGICFGVTGSIEKVKSSVTVKK